MYDGGEGVLGGVEVDHERGILALLAGENCGFQS
jgi:hypothetical protein